MDEALELLKNETYVLQHNPNCPNPYCIRLVGAPGRIDMLPAKQTGDIVGYGKTMVLAAQMALALRRAGVTFDYLFSHPDDPNAKIILAYEGA